MTHESALHQFLKKNIAPSVKRYSRLEVVGLENLPAAGQGAMLACNHSGGLWWDAACLYAALDHRVVSFVAHHWDAKVGLMRNVLEKLDCSFLDESLSDISEQGSVVTGAKSGKLMCLYPEESYHTFRHRYTLFNFSPHIIKYAKIAQVPIIPVSIIGVEEAAPTLFGPKFNKVPLHVPFHFPLILPVKVTVEFGKPCLYDELIPKLPEGLSAVPSIELTDEESFAMAARKLRQLMHDTISKYKKCRLSDEKYIDREGWF